MNINYLRYALEVQKVGSITQAAENLFMSQPNLSRDIKELEESLNIDVFSRTSRGVVTTPEGAEFLEYARRLLEHMDDIEAKFGKSSTKKVTFAISIPRASYIAEAVSKAIDTIEHELGDNYILTVKETNAIDAVNNITEHGYDYGVIRYPIMYETYFKTLLEGKKLESINLVKLKYIVVASAESELAKKKTCTLDELRDYIEIIRGDMTVPYLSLANNIQDLTPSQNSPRKLAVFERGSQFSLLRNVRGTYMWSSIMSEEMLKYNKIRKIECPEADDEYRDCLIFSKETLENPLDARMIELLKETIIATYHEFEEN
ncbi:MAG: LysR family transcriptional regulator [Anaerovoracaceae bacterium]|jgi:DNA-binding transcriptional LysR family regulator